jgi:hypothetical protein
MDSIIVPARLATYAVEVDSLESIPGFLNSLKIPSQICKNNPPPPLPQHTVVGVGWGKVFHRSNHMYELKHFGMVWQRHIREKCCGAQRKPYF